MCFVFQRLLCRQLMQHHRRSLTVRSHLSCYQYQYDQFHDHDNDHHNHRDHYDHRDHHDHDEHQKGKFQCGPASVAAIKMGMIGLAHDVGFVFSEVRIVIIIMVIIIVVIVVIMISLIISIITNIEWLLS